MRRARHAHARGALNLLVAVALTAGTLALSSAAAQAPDLERAIEIAANHPALAAGLARNPGWTADGYGPQPRYGLWRVDFQTASGDELAWAQVRLADGTVFAWETSFELDDDAYDAAQEALLEFLRHDPTFIQLAGDADDHDWSWIGHDADANIWEIYLERGVDSLLVTLRSRGGAADLPADLEIVQIEVPYLIATAEERKMREADAVALAFADPSIADLLRGLDGWSASATNLDADGWSLWQVTFNWDGNVVAETVVDLYAWEVTGTP